MRHPIHSPMIRKMWKRGELGPDMSISSMIVLVLFTNPGEMRCLPEFGCDPHQFVFAPMSGETTTIVQHTVSGALQRWLSGIIEVEDVSVEENEKHMFISIYYHEVRTGRRGRERISFAGE